MRRRAQPVPSSERQRRTSDPAAGRLTRAGADGLWLARATRDQLRVSWSAVTDAVVAWQVVCWDSDDAAVGRLRLSGRHRRATFARLAGLRQPFTIAVSGLGADGSVLWQRGLADLYLRADQTTRDERASDSRPAQQRRRANRGKRDVLAAKRPKKDVAAGKTGGSSKPKPKKKTSRGK
jgi:hypothetical protein